MNHRLGWAAAKFVLNQKFSFTMKIPKAMEAFYYIRWSDIGRGWFPDRFELATEMIDPYLDAI